MKKNIILLFLIYTPGIIAYDYCAQPDYGDSYTPISLPDLDTILPKSPSDLSTFSEADDLLALDFAHVEKLCAPSGHDKTPTFTHEHWTITQPSDYKNFEYACATQEAMACMKCALYNEKKSELAAISRSYPVTRISRKHWELIESCIPRFYRNYKRKDVADVTKDNKRLVVEAVLHKFIHHIRWTDLPDIYGKPHNISTVFTHWRKKNIWNNILGHITASPESCAIVGKEAMAAYREAAHW